MVDADNANLEPPGIGVLAQLCFRSRWATLTVRDRQAGPSRGCHLRPARISAISTAGQCHHRIYPPQTAAPTGEPGDTMVLDLTGPAAGSGVCQ